MKIWIVCHAAVSGADPGGTRHFSLAKELRRLGHEPTIFASGIHYTTGKDRLEGKTGRYLAEDIDGVRFIWIKVSPFKNGIGRLRNMLQFGAGIKAVAREFEKPDVILGSSPHPFAAEAALTVAEDLGVPFVAEVRDLWPATLVELAGMSKMHPLVLWMGAIEKRLYKKAKRIIALLPKANNYIDPIAGSKKVLWIPNGVDLSNIGDPEPPRHPEFVAMYAGNHNTGNGLDVVLEAAKLSPSVRFLLIGDGPTKRALIAQAKDQGLTNVTFEDPVPKSRIFAKLGEANAFIMPLRSSSVFRWGISPNKLWDYMLAARPIVFMVDLEDSPVEAADAGVCIPADNARAMADALMALSTDSPARLRQMGENGQKYVRANHDFKILGERLEKMLLEVTSGK